MNFKSAAKPELRILQEAEAVGLPLPCYETPGSAGMDLRAAISDDSPVLIEPGRRELVSIGIRIAIPEGFEGQVRPRSGLALRHGIGMINSPGTIDSDYRGVLGVILVNWGQSPFTVRRGDRIAQLVISPIVQVALVESEELDSTARGTGGFGSTG